MKQIISCIIGFVLIGATQSIAAQTKDTYTYVKKGNKALKLDVYRPKNQKKSDQNPTLLWIHGGGFAGGARDYKDDAKLGMLMAKKGYTMISISYRLLRKGQESGFGCDCPKEEKLETFKQSVMDYMDAAKFVHQNAEKLNVNPNLIYAGGSSAGAEVVLNAVYMREHFIPNLKPYQDIRFAAVISLAGAVVNSNYITQENAIPTVLHHGDIDKLVPFGSAAHHYCTPDRKGFLMLDGSQTIYKQLQEIGGSVYFLEALGYGHQMAAIPYDDKLDRILKFLEDTTVKNQVIQSKITIRK